ncbi:14386_t:CDS:1, partial [Cetraspora pellucida]
KEKMQDCIAPNLLEQLNVDDIELSEIRSKKIQKIKKLVQITENESEDDF